MRSALAYQKFGRAQPEWGWSNAYVTRTLCEQRFATATVSFHI
jgi:hypothetical protein